MLEIKKNPYNKLVFVGDYPIFTDEISSDENNKKHWQDAHLFAAAPSLLDAVQVVRDALAKNVYECGHPGTWATKLDDMLAETIARAEGRL